MKYTVVSLGKNDRLPSSLDFREYYKELFYSIWEQYSKSHDLQRK